MRLFHTYEHEACILKGVSVISQKAEGERGHTGRRASTSHFLCFRMEVSLGGELFSPLTAWRMGHHKARLLRAVNFKFCVYPAVT